MKTQKNKVVSLSVLTVLIAVATLFGNYARLLAQDEVMKQEEVTQYCAVLLEPLIDVEQESNGIDVGCFESMETMEQAVSSKQADLLGIDAESSVETNMARSVIAQTATGPNFTGIITTWYDPYDFDGCRDGNIFVRNIWGVANNNIESARSYSGCNNLVLFKNTNRWGESITCNQSAASCPKLGWMANKASSVQIRP